jgi:hypothetical protein
MSAANFPREAADIRNSMSGTINMPNFIHLIGHSGRTYAYTVCSPYGTWTTQSGCYAFANLPYLGLPNPQLLYIGLTDSFQRRMSEHSDDMWPRAVAVGANCILARVVSLHMDRVAEEQDLIRSYQPLLNKQHRGLASVRPNSLLGLIAR